ncbi:MAG: hypothetical protein M5U14_12865 [Acidimicrobiia bacterium]|nr:hypothetical protein [Acidimicrobiia bacterium]
MGKRIAAVLAAVAGVVFFWRRRARRAGPAPEGGAGTATETPAEE